jgi:pimeloyl-ACP methyl ester carboxylesterase
VVIRAASGSPLVRAVVTLATQSYGAGAAAELGPRCALLLVHGLEDMVLPHSASVHVHVDAAEPKRLILLDGTGHNLDEAAGRVADETRTWLQEWL